MYITLILKSISNLSLATGNVEMMYTMVIRFPKNEVPEIAMAYIMANGLSLRLNEEPLSVDNDYKNKVLKEKNDMY